MLLRPQEEASACSVAILVLATVEGLLNTVHGIQMINRK
jgi:hypothetical protein